MNGVLLAINMLIQSCDGILTVFVTGVITSDYSFAGNKNNTNIRG